MAVFISANWDQLYIMGIGVVRSEPSYSLSDIRRFVVMLEFNIWLGNAGSK
jgi:hypothetical protein